MAFLEIKGLKSGYTDNIVLNDVSFSVEKGEFIGIIGPNGAGKTTLLKTLTHIIRPKQGSVFLEGEDIHRMSSAEVARAVAMVSQDLISIFSFSTEEIVMMGRTPHIGILGTEKKYDLEIVAEILARIDLEQFRDRPIDELSAGERQRVLIAKALTQQPQLILLDEPTAHLDIGYQIEILDLIKSLNAERKLTVICVLHDLNLASQYCDKLLLLDNGRIAGFAAAKDILRRDTIEKIFNAKVLVRGDVVIGKPVVVPLRKKDIDLPQR